ncbi:uncharacterized protein GGS25DRAFT_491347 [Hypoxylon fragiforme]|uniref:uncharacterized protein n=1 Tax=Hypoxylon fragiforme TaxID=63214 RepID=UPI0020C60A9C|nr:uncharacterized protein GGS25DRAFT_491347 [Hypoxylon fragiforme]KAI2608706.1 hypothetical protein GGS25DRAFT_491347 [Hypoxylon fragiforme]
MAPSWPQRKKPLDEFTLFPLLPAELRIMIWKKSFQLRVVELHTRTGTSQWLSSCRNPSALSVCSESRELALEYFSVALPISSSKLDGRLSRLVYINPAVDLLAVVGQANYSQLTDLFEAIEELDPTGRGLRRFGLNISCFVNHFQFSLMVWNKKHFKRLEAFVLLMYIEKLPPSDFRDGECTVQRLGGLDAFTRDQMTMVRQLFDAEHLLLMSLNFIPA